MESLPETTKLSFDEEKKEVRSYGILAAICALITAFWFIPFIPIKIIAAIAMLGLVGNGWLFLFHGSTVISMLLQGRPRLLFQIFISIVTPILFSIYFLKDAQSITLEGMYVYMFHAWILFPIGIFAYVSFIVNSYLDRYHPFRGFIIASTIFFVLCLIGHHGIRIGSDDDAYGYNDSGDIEVLLTDDAKERQEWINLLKKAAKLSPEERKEFLKRLETGKYQLKEGKLVKENMKPWELPYTNFNSQDEYDWHKEKVENGYFLYMYIIYVVTSYTFMFLGLCWNRWINKASPEEQEKIKEFIDPIYASIKIVSDYGAALEKASEEELVFMPESRLPHSKEKIKNAIGCVEFFIEKALSDERLKKGLIEHPAAVLFGENGAEYVFSEKYRESLKTGLACLDTFVSDEGAEKGK